MKKKLLLFLVCLLLISCGSNKKYTHKLQIDKTQVYKYSVDGSTKTLYLPNLLNEDQKPFLVYSLNPTVENGNYNLESANFYRNDEIDLALKDKIYNYALYGYGYNQLNQGGKEKVANKEALTADDYSICFGDLYNTTNINNGDYIRYYLATQELIWESIVNPKTNNHFEISFNDLDLEKEKEAILNNYINKQNTPYFNGTVQSVTKKDIDSQKVFKLSDKNQVVQNYEITSSPNIDVLGVDGNDISFKVKFLGEGKINFIEPLKIIQNETIILKSDFQVSYLSIGSDRLNLKSSSLLITNPDTSNSITLQIKTFDSKQNSELIGASYQVADNEQFLNPLETSVGLSNAPSQLNDIKPGTYFIKQIKAPEGYQINNKIEKIEIVNGVNNLIIGFFNQSTK